MPEIISKYPTTVLQVLQSANIECGTGEKPKILTKCPTEQFCALPKGELCIFGLNNINQMTQISQNELVMAATSPPIFSALGAIVLIFVLGVGIYIGSRLT